MLVLTRRFNQKIVIPMINTSIQIVSIKPGVVRLGIEAPPHVSILREEVYDRTADAEASVGGDDVTLNAEQLREIRHSLRNRLNAATLGTALLRYQVGRETAEEAGETLTRLEQELHTIRRQVDLLTRAATPPQTPAAIRRPGRALIVEDDRNERELLVGLLRMAGLDVDAVGDGLEALDYLKGTKQPDVVLIDMVLPKCDGRTIVRSIRDDQRLAGLKIFAMTGHDPEYLGIDLQKAGIDRWLTKPLNPQTLLRDLNVSLAG